MKISGHVEQIRELIKQSERITLLTYYNPKLEVINSALVWRNILARRNKSVDLIAPGWKPDSSEYSDVITTLPPKRTTVKIDLGDSRIKKISYELKGNSLYLYLTPDKGVIDGGGIEVSADRLETDLVITFGIRKPEDLSDWPASWAEDIKAYAPIINLDVSPMNTQFGTINVVESEYRLFSKMVFELIKSLGLEMDAVDAGLLLQTVKDATNNFTNNVDAGVFELSAELMRMLEEVET